MKIKLRILLLSIFTLLCVNPVFADFQNPLSNISNPFDNVDLPFLKTKDVRAKELKYQFDTLKEDEKYARDKKLLNRKPSGYMTLDEYESLSEYKDKATFDYNIPKIEKSSDFKYIPQPLYKIVKYNEPAGSYELVLGKRLFLKRQINAQGIVSPDYSMLVYPAVYYYSDSASVSCDLFVIPLDNDESTLNRILKANIAKRIPTPILSTDKTIDNFATFRTLTPVDFSVDGSKLLVKEKIGSSQDGIWETNVHVYDFKNNVSYNIVEVRDAIRYFWKEYMSLNLNNNRWDIYPLGFDATSPDRIVVQAYAYTGKVPVFLGSWSVDYKGEQSRLISFNKDYIPKVSSNGFKIVQSGVKSYQTVELQEKYLKSQDAYKIKNYKAKDKEAVKKINQEYKYKIKALDDEYKDEYRDYKKLQSFNGSTSTVDLENAYQKYLQDTLKKDISDTEKLIQKKQNNLDKIDERIKILEESLK